MELVEEVVVEVVGSRAGLRNESLIRGGGLLTRMISLNHEKDGKLGEGSIIRGNGSNTLPHLAPLKRLTFVE